jgi:DNA-binding transcriptional LysR family regulator
VRQLEGLDLVESFAVVAEELNFRRGAERLAIDQSALSRRISRLEALLGFSLFERSTREVVLTPAGRAFYQETGGTISGYLRAVETARTIALGHAGILRVAYMAFAAVSGMPAAVARFRARRPRVALALEYVHTRRQKVMLASAEIDVGFLIGPVENQDLAVHSLGADPLVVVYPPGHRFAELESVPAPDVLAEPLILGDRSEWGFFRERLDSLFAPWSAPLEPAFQSSNVLALAGLVEAGLGVSILPRSTANALGCSARARAIDGPLTIETVLAWRAADASTLVRDFVAAACDTRDPVTDAESGPG